MKTHLAYTPAQAAALAAQPLVSFKRVRKPFDWALWIVPFCFIYVFIFSPMTTMGINVEGSAINLATAEGSSGNKLFWLGMLVVTCYAWFTRPDKTRRGLGWPGLLLMAYVALELCSAAWSTVPMISLRRSVLQAVVVFCLIMPFALVDDVRKILLRIAAVLAVAMVINVLVMPLVGLPAFGYRGIYGQKNGMGQIAVIAFYFAIYAALSYKGTMRLGYVGVCFLALALCAASRSKTSLALSILMPLVALVIVAANRVRDPLARIAFWLAVGAVVALLTFICIGVPIGVKEISIFLFHDETFTGRTKIWNFVDYFIHQSPWLGHGYGSFWGIGNATPALNQGFIGGLLQAHNGYLDILLENGYTGMILMVVTVLVVVYGAVRLMMADGKLGFLLMSCVLFVLLNNTMESSLMRGFVPLWVIMLACAGVVGSEQARLRRRRRAEKTQQQQTMKQMRSGNGLAV
jgi:exopolysaccharide production protein ExoQ